MKWARPALHAGRASLGRGDTAWRPFAHKVITSNGLS